MTDSQKVALPSGIQLKNEDDATELDNIVVHDGVCDMFPELNFIKDIKEPITHKGLKGLVDDVYNNTLGFSYAIKGDVTWNEDTEEYSVYLEFVYSDRGGSSLWSQWIGVLNNPRDLFEDISMEVHGKTIDIPVSTFSIWFAATKETLDDCIDLLKAEVYVC